MRLSAAGRDCQSGLPFFALRRTEPGVDSRSEELVATVGAFPTVGSNGLTNPRLIQSTNQPWLPAVTPLEPGAGDEIAVLVALNNDGERQVLHARSIFLLQS